MLILDIGVALIVAKVMGYFFEKYNQPAVIGEMVTGMVLGKYILGYLMDISGTGGFYPFDYAGGEFEDVAHLGIIFLLFISGLETNLEQVKSTGKVATVSTLGGVFLPLALGYIVGKLMGYGDKPSLVIGVLLTATSIGVTARTMMDLGVLKSEVGAASLSASVMDDILGLVLIVLVTGSGSVEALTANITLFFFITIVIGFKTIGKFMDLGDKVHTAKALVSISIGVMFLFSAFAEYTLSAAIEGAYFAGLLMSTTVQSRRIVGDVKSIGYAIFIPLFFVFIGAMVKLSVFLRPDVIVLSTVILLTAIIGKVFGRGAGAAITGFPLRKSFQMGVGSIPRMEVALISMTIAIKVGAVTGAVADKFFAATFVFVTVTTLITPPLLKWVFKKEVEEMQTGKASSG